MKRGLVIAAFAGLFILQQGCLPWSSNPVADAVPARRVPTEYLERQPDAGDSREYLVRYGSEAPRKCVLPLDYDLRVMDVVAIYGGPLPPGGVNANGLNGSLIAAGIDKTPSEQSVKILRRTKENGQIRIAINLNRAQNHRNENLVILPGDEVVIIPPPFSLSRWFHETFEPRKRDVVVPGGLIGNFP